MKHSSKIGRSKDVERMLGLNKTNQLAVVYSGLCIKGGLSCPEEDNKA